MNPNEPFEIDELLRQYSFDELGAAERAFVLNQIADRSEYEMLRSIVLESSQTDQEQVPDDLKSDLMAVFDEKHGSKKAIVFLLFKNKSWLLAAATIAVLLGIWWVLPFGKNDKPMLAERKVMPSQIVQDSVIAQPELTPENSDSIKPEPSPVVKVDQAPEKELIAEKKEIPHFTSTSDDNDKDADQVLFSAKAEVADETRKTAVSDSELTHGVVQEDETSRLVMKETVVVATNTSKQRSVNQKKENAIDSTEFSESEKSKSLTLSKNENWLEGHYTAY